MRPIIIIPIAMVLLELLSTLAISSSIKNFKKDFGAKGDGISDDSEAWSRVITHYNLHKGGTLIVPEGIYRVGAQKTNWNSRKDVNYSSPKYNTTLSEIDGLLIQGTLKGGKIVSIFKYLSGIKYGFFNPDTGTQGLDVTLSSHASPGTFLTLGWDCKNVIIKNLELDGNFSEANYKAAPKDMKGPDLTYSGIASYMARNVVIENVYAHHFGLDGIYIQTPREKLTPGKFHTTLSKVRSEYNGRQGLSFTVGSNLKVINSSFKYTGMGGIRISPCANVDIENHDNTGAPLANSIFENCIISSNQGGSGSVNIAGKVDNIHFKNCVIDAGPKIKDTNRIYSVQMNFSPSRNVSFDNCKLTGVFLMYQPGKKMDDDGFTLLKNCTITDNNVSNDIPETQPLIDVYDQIKFDNCTFFVSPKRKFIRSSTFSKTELSDAEDVTFKNCKVMNLKTRKTIPDIKARVTSNIKFR
ncbi:right-handed parallel beta-helix repeat-containing protein [Dyadobacter sp. CY312]|uniref:right-handed parallel beta-helix repeat-containing protein n=1 Tax=Dyadobacter sp. CY312 TaxID=2907303 RepID=UPI001F328D9F|nr:right-handed parallel beta-helix repeat-containing protein [Dyadobacter sp. CY312]MCE7041276.1 right-handed parallel beta-helix repeat-containing protein [Dyadobacter sp. CY312]